MDELEPTSFRGLEGLAEQRTSWETLLPNSAADPLFAAFDWTLAHARAFAPPGEPFGWVFRSGGRPRAVVAFRPEPSRGWLRLRRLLWSAGGTFDTECLEPVVERGWEEPLARRLPDLLAAVPRTDVVVLEGLRAGHPFTVAIEGELERRGWPVRRHDASAWVLDLPSSLEELLGALKPRMRTRIRQALRRAHARGRRAVLTRDPEALDRHLDELFELHRLRHETAGRSGSFADARRRRFYRDIARAFLQAGTLRLYRLVDPEGRAVAVQLGWAAGGLFRQLQEGFHPRAASERVGIALRARVLEALMAEGVRTCDFGPGGAHHKRSWGARLREAGILSVSMPRWRPRLTYELLAWAERARLRSGTP